MRRFSLVCLSLLAALGATSVESKPLPGPTYLDGPNCHAISRASGQDTLFVGTVLGGKMTNRTWGDGTFVDYKTFQGCFVTDAACQIWVTNHASRYKSPPGYARCTRVFVGLNPAR